MAITIQDVEHIAKLARLRLTEEEKLRFQKELGKIIEYFDQLKKLNTDGVPPTTHVVPLENVLREDAVKPCLSVEEALANAPDRKGNYFRVPKVVEKEG
ncbi:MAG: aspartyl/glutamyl-tRNA amidotransferase subunit C [candidate division Zixibacteria bacterium RBG-1]|nr:MAG: aspartyl/glutamyl-tRNA amidotransferase subunit C [candidate division Zixibacteria bacterium RBG-1]OGC86541.1 MAG: asparaginyl/glutamyl-tRNA amidotransferase subunit C [candidate division Zixibacteria bacterium RBG_19FT_COMBO_42_43]